MEDCTGGVAGDYLDCVLVEDCSDGLDLIGKGWVAGGCGRHGGLSGEARNGRAHLHVFGLALKNMASA